jgi:hypothetical protein
MIPVQNQLACFIKAERMPPKRSPEAGRWLRLLRIVARKIRQGLGTATILA